MPDALLTWNGDLSVSSSGDIQLCGGPVLGQQRILRRLLTNAADYVWHPAYGAGLGQFVGQANAGAAIAGVVYAQIFQESCVATQPVPQVSAKQGADGSVNLTILYESRPDGATQTLTFSMSY